MGDFVLIRMKNRPDIMKLIPSAADNWHILARLDYDPKQDIDSNLIMLKLADYSFIESIPESYTFHPLQRKNWHIRTFKNACSNPNVESYTPRLEYANFCHIRYYDKNQYKIISDSTQYQEDIKVCVYSHTYICEYSDIYIYAYSHMSNPEIAQECGLALPGIMTDCKNLFLQEQIGRASCRERVSDYV